MYFIQQQTKSSNCSIWEIVCVLTIGYFVCVHLRYYMHKWVSIGHTRLQDAKNILWCVQSLHYNFFTTYVHNCIYVHMQKCKYSLYERHQKLMSGNTLIAPSPLPQGFLSLCFKTLRHLLFVLLSFLLHWFQITVGLKETQNKTRRQGGKLEGMPVKA